MNLTALKDVSQASIDKVQEILKAGGSMGLPTGVEKSITTATGLVNYNLEPAAKLLQPVLTPFRNRTPRMGNTRGGTSVNWKAITNLDVTRTDPFTAEATKAATVSYTVASKSSIFATISKGDNVSFQSQKAGLGFEDVRAQSSIRLLKNVMIIEEQALWGGRTAALGTVTAPTVTVVDGGGTIADAAHYYCVARAITNLGRGKKSSETDVTGAAANGSDSAFKMSTPWVEGAVAYDWYVGTVSGSTKYQGRTQINSINLTAYDAGGAALPADDSADANAFDGFIAQATAANGASVTTLATGTEGTGTDFTLNDIDSLLQTMWDSAQADPEVAYMNSQQHRRLSNLWLAANGGPTQFISSAPQQGTLTGGYFVKGYMNPVTGKVIELVTNPWVKPGSMYFVTEQMPFPASDIINPIEIETQYDYLQLDYAVTAPKWEFEVMVMEALKIYFAQGIGILRNCSTKTSA